MSTPRIASMRIHMTMPTKLCVNQVAGFISPDTTKPAANHALMDSVACDGRTTPNVSIESKMGLS